MKGENKMGTIFVKATKTKKGFYKKGDIFECYPQTYEFARWKYPVYLTVDSQIRITINECEVIQNG
jgi:hypothetical protein